MDRETLFRSFAGSRAKLLAAFEGMSEADMTGRCAVGKWTVKDLIGHVAAWEVACLAPLKAYAAGGEFEAEVIPDHDRWNEIQFQRRKDRSLAEILGELNSVRQELLDTARGLDTGRWEAMLVYPWGEQGDVGGMLSGLAYHDEEHAQAILEWRHTQERDLQ